MNTDIIDKNKVEDAAVDEVKKYIRKCRQLRTQNFTTQDKQMSFDGEICISRTEQHIVGNLLAPRVPVQIKGTTKIENNFYQLERKYLRDYRAERGCVFFMVHVEKINYEPLKVLYAMLSLDDINALLEQKTKTIKINLEDVPSNPNEFEKELISFAKERDALPIENPAPSEIASLVIRFKDLENHLDKVTDKGEKIELKSFIDSIKRLKYDGSTGWRDAFVYLSRKVLNYFIKYIPEYDALDLQIELGNYLCQQKLYHMVGDFYSQALEKCRERAKTYSEYNEHVAGILNNLAILHWNNNQLDAAKSELNEALEYYIKLDKDSPNVARTRNNLANLHRHLKNFDEAENEYKNALEAYRKLSKNNHGKYRADLAMTLNNLGILHRNINNFTDAKVEYNEALETYIELAKSNPNVYLDDVAKTLNNVAVLHVDLNNNGYAEITYEWSLRIYRILANANPYTYRADLAMSLNNLGDLHYKLDALDDAKKEFEEALEIYKKLEKDNPDAYSSYVAITLNHIGLLYWKDNKDNNHNKYNIAKSKLEDAEQIQRKLVANNPDAYLADLATTLNNIGIVNKYLGEPRLAEDAYNEALMMRINLCYDNSDAYLADVAETLFNIALLLMQDKLRKDEAIQKCEYALFIFTKLTEKAPQRFKNNMVMAQELLDEINNL